MIDVSEIRRHASPDDCWLVIDGKVWDFTDFAPRHPGGAGIIYRNAGRDASTAYGEVHAPNIVTDELDSSKCMGDLNKATLPEDWANTSFSPAAVREKDGRPPLDTIINAYDFERVAAKVLSKKTWAFYSSAATDCITRDANKSMLDRIWFRPRLMRNVRIVSTRSTILGCSVSCPIFISPSAMAKLAHPEGEKAMARACEATHIIQCVSSNASFTLADIVSQTSEIQPTFFQLYVNSDRSKTRAVLENVLSLRPRIKAIIVTIDAPVPGKREADERLKVDEGISVPNNSGISAKNDARGGGLGRIMGSYIDAGLIWEDLSHIREQVGPEMPIVIKGIQTAADAKLAMDAACQGILVSNHGGRSLDTSPPAILTLLEIHRCCPEVFEKMEVYIDGGIRRGTDILKCLCLGATAVGLGRPFLYSIAYGQEGVEHLVNILKDELETSMKLVGLTSIEQAHPGLVNTLDIDHIVPDDIRSHPYARVRSRARL